MDQFFASLQVVAQRNGLDSVGKLIMASPFGWVPPERSDVIERYRHLWASYSGKDLLDPRPESRRVPEPTTDQIKQLRVRNARDCG